MLGHPACSYCGQILCRTCLAQLQRTPACHKQGAEFGIVHCRPKCSRWQQGGPGHILGGCPQA